jgi:hypothetical protein
MTRAILTAWATALVLIVGPARADDQADAKALLDKAIKAHGGEEALARNKSKVEVVKGKGKFYGMGEGIDFTMEMIVQHPDRIRSEIELEVGGMQIKFLQVVNGNKGWQKLADQLQDMTKEQLEEAKAQFYLRKVVSLLPLRDKEYKLSPLGEVKIESKPAVGLRVEHKGERDVNLFFDKESGLLVKTEMKARDPMAGDKEFNSESYYSDYRKVDGVQTPFKLSLKRDGEKYVESESTEVKREDKVDETTFAKP